jgi:hypothetical protein
MIPGSILNHPVDDEYDDFDPEWHEVGGEGYSANLEDDSDDFDDRLDEDERTGPDDPDALDPDSPIEDDWDEDDFPDDPSGS